MPTTRYANQTFHGKSFDVDECFFVNCVLKECDLFYAGGDFSWQDSKFENCRWQFRGRALTTVNLLRTIGLLPAPEILSPVPPSSSKLPN